MDLNLFFLGYAVYLLATVNGLAIFWFEVGFLTRTFNCLIGCGFILQTIGLVVRTIAGRQLPFSNLCEFIILLSWLVAGVYLLVYRKKGGTIYGLPALIVILILLGYALVFYQKAQPLVPALQSPWLQFHVICAILAYSFFTFSFVMAVMLLLQAKNRKHISTPSYAEKQLFSCAKWGFAFMTLVLLTGAVWAEQAWGTWWSWDPKETWALITWLVYTILLHSWRYPSWSIRVRAWIAVGGFIAVVFTLLGVTYLMSGLHSYL